MFVSVMCAFVYEMVLRCRWAVGVLWAVLTTCYAILTAVSTNYLKFLFLKSALSPKSIMTIIILPVIILNARSCSWRTSGLVTRPHLGARETLVFGAGAQTGCLVNTIHLNITIFDIIILLHATVNLWRWYTDRSLSPSGSTSSHQIHFDPPHP